ncbi:MAG: ABC transporter permease [Gemmatimonadales bacterium]|jgi:putative ABC transport system permease protein
MTASRSTSILTTLAEGIGIALDSLRTSKTRAGLTILGIAIGVMVVMGMSAAVKGINSSFEDAIASIGPKTFFVFRYFQGGIQVGGGGRNAPWRHNPPITQDEAKLIARLPDVRDVIMTENRNATVQVGDQSEDNVVIAGRGAAWPQVAGGDVTAGRSYTNIEDAASERVVVLNTKLAVRLYGQLDPIDRTMKILGQQYRVIGVYEPPPNLFGGGNDYIVIMPWVTFHHNMNVPWGWANLAVLPTDQATIEDAMDQVMSALRRSRGLRPDQDNTFALVTQDKILEIWGQLTGVFFVVMIALSGVGLMVGGVGVVAVMMISVTERTREIGVRKALGATQGEILWQFLVEAATLTLIGGAVGMILGGGLAYAVAHLTPVPAKVPPLAIVAALGASVLTGIVFGIVPAQRAARMDPVEALRYE